jgi:hypothetical protein
MRRRSLLPAASSDAEIDPPEHRPPRKRSNEDETGKDGPTSKLAGKPARRKSGTRKSAASELSSVSLASLSSYQQSDEGDELESAGNSAGGTGACSASDSASLQGVERRRQGPRAGAVAAAIGAAQTPPHVDAKSRGQERVDQGRRARRGHETGRESLGNGGGNGSSRRQTKANSHEAHAETDSGKAMDGAAPADGAVSDDASVEPPADHEGLEQTVAQMLNAVQVGRKLLRLDLSCILECICRWRSITPHLLVTQLSVLAGAGGEHRGKVNRGEHSCGADAGRGL